MGWTFTTPWALLLLGLAVPLVLLFFIRGRRKRHGVPHLPFWTELEDSSVRRRHRLTEVLSLLLLLGALSALALSSAGLTQVETEPRATHTVFIFDVSPSMAARGADEQTRLSLARQKLTAALVALPPRGTATLLTSEGRIAASSAPPGKVLTVLSRLSPKGSGHRLLRTARDALAVADEGDCIAVVTDQARPAWWTGPGRDWLVVGRSLGNAGFVEAYSPPVPWWAECARVAATLAHYGPSPRQVTVSLRQGGEERVLAGLELSPGKPVTETFPIPRTGPFSLCLNGSDGLTWDDELHGVAHPRGPRRLVLVTDGQPDLFLEAALGVLPDLVDPRASQVYTAQSFGEARPDCDILLLYRTPGAALPPGAGVVSFGVPPSLVRSGPILSDAPVARSNPFHPVTAGLSFDGVFFRRAHGLAGGTPLLETPEGTVATALETPRQRIVAFGFTLERTNLSVEASFPVLLRNAIRWVGERKNAAAAQLGSLETWAPKLEHGGCPVRPGFYSLGDDQAPKAVSLLSPAESDLQQAAGIDRGTFTLPPGTEPVHHPLDGILALAGLAFLLLELLRASASRFSRGISPVHAV